MTPLPSLGKEGQQVTGHRNSTLPGPKKGSCRMKTATGWLHTAENPRLQ